MIGVCGVASVFHAVLSKVPFATQIALVVAAGVEGHRLSWPYKLKPNSGSMWLFSSSLVLALCVCEGSRTILRVARLLRLQGGEGITLPSCVAHALECWWMGNATTPQASLWCWLSCSICCTRQSTWCGLTCYLHSWCLCHSVVSYLSLRSFE